jgi:hypothetical protein
MAIEECRVYGPDGKIKRVISAEECAEMFWADGAGLDELILKPGASTKKKLASKNRSLLCIECKEVFIATQDRTHCHNPCTDPLEKSTRIDPKYSSRLCEQCKKEFTPSNGRRVYCHDPCISKTHARKIALLKRIPCKLCNQIFQTTSKFKYCNMPCNRYLAYTTKIKARKAKALK